MSVWGKERHLTFRIPAIGAVCVGLDEFPDGETIRSFLGGDSSVFAHVRSPCSIRLGVARQHSRGPRFEKPLDSEPTQFAARAQVHDEIAFSELNHQQSARGKGESTFSQVSSRTAPSSVTPRCKQGSVAGNDRHFSVNCPASRAARTFSSALV